MYSDSHTDPLASVPLFADLPPEERAVLLEKMQLLSVRKGEHVVHQGDQADCLYYVLRGRLDVLRDGHLLVAEIGSGEPVGEIAFFADTQRTADVVASRDSQLLRLGRTEFEQVSAMQPQLVLSILRTFGRRLASATTGAPVGETSRNRKRRRLPAASPDAISDAPRGVVTGGPRRGTGR